MAARRRGTRHGSISRNRLDLDGEEGTVIGIVNTVCRTRVEIRFDAQSISCLFVFTSGRESGVHRDTPSVPRPK